MQTDLERFVEDSAKTQNFLDAFKTIIADTYEMAKAEFGEDMQVTMRLDNGYQVTIDKDGDP
jgi:hypothetical protein